MTQKFTDTKIKTQKQCDTILYFTKSMRYKIYMIQIKYNFQKEMHRLKDIDKKHETVVRTTCSILYM